MARRAAGQVGKPGSEFGPCKGKCKHIDCESLRMVASSLCGVCKKPIGYEVSFVMDKEKQSRVHLDCFAEKNGIKNVD